MSSIRERIAALNSSSNNDNNNSKNSGSVNNNQPNSNVSSVSSPPPMINLDGDEPGGGRDRRKSLTISERIALMKMRGVETKGNNKNTEGKAATSGSIEPPKEKEKEEKRLSVSEKIDQAKSSTASTEISDVSDDRKKSENENKESSSAPSSTSLSSSSEEEVKPQKRLSVAEKIALMKARSEAEAREKEELERKKKSPPNSDRQSSIASRIANMKNKSIAETNAMLSVSTSSKEEDNEDGNGAEMKSEPSFVRPKSATIIGNEVSTGSAEDDARPLSTPRKGKLNPNLVARASMVMPMGMGMPPGLMKRSSVGDLSSPNSHPGRDSALLRSASMGSIRVTNDNSSGEITHSTMTRARASKKKRKSSAPSLSLLKGDMEALQSIQSVDRVSTVQEESEDNEESEETPVPTIQEDEEERDE